LSFAEIFGFKKLESLAILWRFCVILRLAVSVEHRLVTERQTRDYGIIQRRLSVSTYGELSDDQSLGSSF